MAFIDNEQFFTDLLLYSKNKIIYKEDIKALINNCRITQKHHLLDEVTFSAKYVRGLMRVLQSSHENPEIKNINEIKNDYTMNLQKTHTLLSLLVHGLDDSFRGSFESKFLQMTPEGFAEFNRLLSDLEWVKMYLNHLKHG